MNLKNIPVSERSKIQKVTYYIIPFMWNAQNRLIHTAEHRLVVTRAKGGTEYERHLLNGYKVSFRGNEKVLELDKLGVVQLGKCTTFSVVNFMYVNFTSINTQAHTNVYSHNSRGQKFYIKRLPSLPFFWRL